MKNCPQSVRWVGVLMLTTSAMFAQAGEASFTLGNKSVYAKISDSPSPDKSNFSAGYLYHNGARHILDIGAHAQGQTAIGNLPTTTGIGAKAIFFKQHETDGQALSLGGYATVNLPEVPGLSVHGALYYAPEITSFTDAEGVSWLELEGRYRVIPNADVKFGYRHIRSGLDSNKSVTLDSGFHLGINLLF